MQVKATKAVTEVTLALTGEEAAVLMGILFAVNWDNSLHGTLAADLYDSLENVDIESAPLVVEEDLA